MTEMEVTQEMQTQYSVPDAWQLPQSRAHAQSIKNALRDMKYGKVRGVEKRSAPVATQKKPVQAVAPLITKPVGDKLSWVDAMKLRKALRERRESDPILALRGSEVTKVVESECAKAFETGNLDLARWMSEKYDITNYGYETPERLRGAGKELYFHLMQKGNPVAASHVGNFIREEGFHFITDI